MPSPPRRLVACALGLMLLAAGARPAVASWNSDSTLGLPVCTVTGEVLDPIMVSDEAGGFIIMWTDYRKPGFDPDLYCQRVSAAGETLWTANGVVVCNAVGVQQLATMVSDGHGGAFMAWASLQPVGYYMQHIGPNGVRRWAANGINRVGGFNSIYGPKICRDTTGGIFMAFASGNPGTQIQRFDSTGALRLGSFPPAEGPLLRSNPSAPLAIAPDGSGGAIVAVGYGTNLVDFAAQRVTAAGALLWPGSSVTVSAASGTQNQVDLVADGTGGAVFAWSDSRNGKQDIYMQRISAAGTALWTADGAALCLADTTQLNPQLESLPDGTTIAAWKDYRHLPAASIYAQRIALDGSAQWAADGVPVCSAVLSGGAGIYSLTLATTGADSTLVGWSTSGTAGDVFAQKLDGAGTHQWGEYGVTLCRGPNAQNMSVGVGDGHGGLYMGYRDDRNVGNPDLYAAHVGPNGELGGLPVGVPWSDVIAHEVLFGAPNPAHGTQVLSLARPLGPGARVEVLDIGGRRRLLRALAPGTTTWSWDGRGDDGGRVRPGVYLVRATDGERVAIARVVRLD